MALPVAPLGSFSNINLPNYIPGHSGPERDPIKAALMAFLQGAAQTGGQKLVGNAMSRDYSGQPASFGEKLLSGPREGAEQFGQRTQNTAVMDRLDKEITGVNSRLEKTINAERANTILRSNDQRDNTNAQITAHATDTDKRLFQQRLENEASSKQTNRRLDQGDAALTEEKATNATRMKESLARLDQIVKDGDRAALQADEIRANTLKAGAETARINEDTRTYKAMNNMRDEQRLANENKNPLKGAKLPGKTKDVPAPTKSVLGKENPPGVGYDEALRRLDSYMSDEPFQSSAQPGRAMPPMVENAQEKASPENPTAAYQPGFDPSRATYGDDIMAMLEQLLGSGGSRATTQTNRPARLQ